MAYALNVRPQQLDVDRTEIRIYCPNYYRAVRLIGRTVMLYRPRHEALSGYFGTARLLGVEYDRMDPKWIWVALERIVPFPNIVSLDQLYGATFTNDSPFYTYSRSLRPISPYEVERLLAVDEVAQSIGLMEADDTDELLSPPLMWKEQKTRLRNKLIRDELLRLYGPNCVLTEKLFTTLSGRFFETRVGHIVPLGCMGPDTIQNTLPMCSVANWHWDNGLVSLTNAGRILLAKSASADAKGLFEEGRQIRFANSRVWPKAEYLEWHRDNIFEKGHRNGLVWREK